MVYANQSYFQDEAFELGQQWAKLYKPDSPSYKLISEIMDTSFLVNVVHNDFHDSEAIFKPFLKAGAEFLAMNPKTKTTTTTVNGY
jgi:methylenetetrahydrofolate reductase (NADPH)